MYKLDKSQKMRSCRIYIYNKTFKLDSKTQKVYILFIDIFKCSESIKIWAGGQKWRLEMDRKREGNGIGGI